MNIKRIFPAIVMIAIWCFTAPMLHAQTTNPKPITMEMVTWDDSGFELPNPLPAKYQYILLYDAKPLVVTDKVYGENVDRAPLFAETCLTNSDPEQCSNEMIKQFIKDNIEYPEKASRKNHDGLEHVIIVINEFGKIDGNIQVISKEEPCAGCTQAAVNVVKKMQHWVPARKDGLAVKAKVIIPIEFETVGYER